MKKSFSILNENRNKMNEIYNKEISSDLMREATNSPDRYKPVKHDCLQIGDVVLLKEINIKYVNFPMGIVTRVTTNTLGEVTNVEVRKGNRETVKRHVKSLILLLKNGDLPPGDLNVDTSVQVTDQSSVGDIGLQTKPKRQAAIKCKEKMAVLIDEDLV